MSSNDTSRIYVVEGATALRQALVRYLSRLPGVMVCGFATCATDALRSIGSISLDLALIDIDLTDMDGVALIQRLRRRGCNVPCIIISSHPEHAFVDRALAAGANAYVLMANPRELDWAVRAVLDGGTYLTSGLGRTE